MKTFFSVLVALCVVILSACGGNPIGPTDGPSVGNTVSNSFSVTISPASVALGAGGSQVFMASASGQNTRYLWSEVQPSDSFDVATNFGNSARVTMRTRPSGMARTTVQVEAWGVNGEHAIAKATIDIR